MRHANLFACRFLMLSDYTFYSSILLLFLFFCCCLRYSRIAACNTRPVILEALITNATVFLFISSCIDITPCNKKAAVYFQTTAYCLIFSVSDLWIISSALSKPFIIHSSNSVCTVFVGSMRSSTVYTPYV